MTGRFSCEKILCINLFNRGSLCSRGPVGIYHQAAVSPFLPIAHSFLPLTSPFLSLISSFLPTAPPSLHVLLSPHFTSHCFPHTFIWVALQISGHNLPQKTEQTHFLYIYPPVVTWTRKGARSSTSSSSSWPFIEKRRLVCFLLILFLLLTESRIPCSWSGGLARRPWSFPSEVPS